MEEAKAQQDVSKPNRDLTLLCPSFLTIVELALKTCHDEDFPVFVFEGFRSPQRQDHLYGSGRTRPGNIVSKAKGWQSWHQYGLAVDLAFKRQGQWSWEGSFQDVARIMTKAGLEWGGIGDQGHFQIAGGLDIKTAAQVTRECGLQTLWQIVFKKMEVRYKG
jgi:hypothetical protein